MEPTTTTSPEQITSAPGLRFTLTTRYEAFCPCCGYSLTSVAVVLLSHGRDNGQGQYNITAVCARCYQTTLRSALDAAAALQNPWLQEHSEFTRGVHFLMPSDARFCGRTAREIVDFIVDGAPFQQQIYAEPPPQSTEPDAGQGRLDFDAPHPDYADWKRDAPNADHPPAYDPSCPADCR